MTHNVACLTVCCCLITASAATGQTPKRPDSERKAALNAIQAQIEQAEAQAEKAIAQAAVEYYEMAQSSKTHDQREMYEDIEILRRLFAERLQGLYGSQRLTQTVTDSGLMPLAELSSRGLASLRQLQVEMTTSSPLAIEGVYLKGQGVVFTVTLPARDRVVFGPHGKHAAVITTCAKCHSTAVQKQAEELLSKVPKPPSAWEQTRRKLLGLKDEPDDKPKPANKLEICVPGSLGEVVLELLAENGRHFSKLADDENLTIAMTFRPDKRNTTLRARQRTSSLYRSESMPRSAAFYVGARPAKSPPSPAKRTATQSNSSAQKRALPSSVRDYLLLGDLHMKQGKSTEAMSAYKNALEAFPRADEQVVIELHQKLAQAALTAQKLDLAKKSLDKLLELEKNKSKAKSAKPKTSLRRLPQKLIISVPKKLFDEIAAGKISYQQFKKAASIQHILFTTAK